jgi:hypothetical protein
MSPVSPLGKLRREVSRLVLQANTLRMLPLALTTRRRFLFILGHMRSGSTLLSHLLCSSQEIIGYGETHNNYRHRGDFAKLLMSVRTRTQKNPLRYRYVLDKIVGTGHVISRPVLTDARTRYIFLIREPLASLASIVAMRRQYQRTETDEHLVAFATEHYTQRLGQLLDLAAMIGDRGRCLLVTHQQLLLETPETFKALESFLDLRAPLRETYEVTPTTGVAGIGDPSPNIRLGKISRSLPNKHLDLSAPLLARIELCYEDFIKTLCTTVQAVGSQDRSRFQRAA